MEVFVEVKSLRRLSYVSCCQTSSQSGGCGPTETRHLLGPAQKLPTALPQTLGNMPVLFQCPHCGYQGSTNIRPSPGNCSHLCSVGCCLVGGVCGCCLVPYYDDSTGSQDYVHECPKCGVSQLLPPRFILLYTVLYAHPPGVSQAEIGVNYRIGGPVVYTEQEVVQKAKETPRKATS